MDDPQNTNRNLAEDLSQGDLQVVPPELRPNVFFDSLEVQPELAISALPTTASCPICHNLTKNISGVEVEEARSFTDSGCLGCKLIICALEKFIQEFNPRHEETSGPTVWSYP